MRLRFGFQLNAYFAMKTELHESSSVAKHMQDYIISLVHCDILFPGVLREGGFFCFVFLDTENNFAET